MCKGKLKYSSQKLGYLTSHIFEPLFSKQDYLDLLNAIIFIECHNKNPEINPSFEVWLDYIFCPFKNQFSDIIILKKLDF